MFEGEIPAGQDGIDISDGLGCAFGAELLGLFDKTIDIGEIARFERGILICIAGKQYKKRDDGC
ncbi:MAG: hypothetical protein JST68_11555 [Bacteroidetes bacterium]|nr:hypothetical protein [Bacteroidota bacterium]